MNSYVQEKVDEWRKEIIKLADFAKTQPHAAFSAYIHGQQHRFTYFLRTIEGMEDYLKPLGATISNILLPPYSVQRLVNNRENYMRYQLKTVASVSQISPKKRQRSMKLRESLMHHSLQ